MQEAATYPPWVLEVARPGDVLDDSSLMRATIRVTMASMERSGGGPFGALLATGTGTIISIGYNLVLPEKDSTAHAEVVAIRRAERALGTHSLRGPHLPRLRLFTTCAPCIMCVGAVHWAGIPEVVAAARASDAEAIGFVEGPRSFDAVAFLRERGIEYRADFLRDEALEIFRKYQGPVYNG